MCLSSPFLLEAKPQCADRLRLGCARGPVGILCPNTTDSGSARGDRPRSFDVECPVSGGFDGQGVGSFTRRFCVRVSISLDLDNTASTSNYLSANCSEAPPSIP